MIHKTFSVDGSADLEIRIESGRIEIMPGAAGVIDVKVDTKMNNFIVDQTGNSVLVSSDKSTSWWSRGTASVLVEVPEGTDVNIGVASARVSSAVPLGKVNVRSASGHIDLVSAETIAVKTASGDLDVEKVERSLRFTSAAGDLRVTKRASGSVKASTASGDVHIEHADGSLQTSTASGDVYISYFEGREASFKAMSGDIDINVPPRTKVSLDASVMSGKLRLPDTPARKEPPLRHMTVNAKTVSGDFTLSLTDPR